MYYKTGNFKVAKRENEEVENWADDNWAVDYSLNENEIFNAFISIFSNFICKRKWI